MKKLFSLFILFSFVFSAFALDQDIFKTLSFTEAGYSDTISLVNFYSKHMFVPYYVSNNISTTEFTITTTKVCTNSSALIGVCSNTDSDDLVSTLGITTAKTCNASGAVLNSCADTNARGGNAYTINETDISGSVMNITINITNATLGTYMSTFDIIYRAGYYGTNSSGTTGMYLWNGATWVQVATLATGGYSDERISSLDPMVYAQNNITQVMFLHSTNATTGNTGISVDYLAIDHVQNPMITVNETAGAGSRMNLTINITNSSLSNSSSSFDIQIVGGYFGLNQTGNTSIHLWNGSHWISQDRQLSVNTFGSVILSGLSVDTYAKLNQSLVLFNHSSNATTGNTGITIKSIKIVQTANTTVTPSANITLQASIDNLNWFNYSALTDVTEPSISEINRTARFVRFHVPELKLANSSGNGLYISYAAIGGRN